MGGQQVERRGISESSEGATQDWEVLFSCQWVHASQIGPVRPRLQVTGRQSASAPLIAARPPGDKAQAAGCQWEGPRPRPARGRGPAAIAGTLELGPAGLGAWPGAAGVTVAVATGLLRHCSVAPPQAGATVRVSPPRA